MAHFWQIFLKHFIIGARKRILRAAIKSSPRRRDEVASLDNIDHCVMDSEGIKYAEDQKQAQKDSANNKSWIQIAGGAHAGVPESDDTAVNSLLLQHTWTSNLFRSEETSIDVCTSLLAELF